MGKFSYKIFPELNLCYSYFSGDTNIDDIYNFINVLTRDETYHPSISSIVDFRMTDLYFKKNDGKNYVDFVRGNPDIKGERQVAFLTTTPQQTVNSIEYQMLARGLPMRVDVFTTLGACLNWCHIPIINIDMINDFILSQK